MNQAQQGYFYQIVYFLSQQVSNYKFCLNVNFYSICFANSQNNTPTANDRKIIGKEFSRQVKQNHQVTAFDPISNTQATANVNFDFIFSNCPRCGFKDSSNKTHYITI